MDLSSPDSQDDRPLEAAAQLRKEAYSQQRDAPAILDASMRIEEEKQRQIWPEPAPDETDHAAAATSEAAAGEAATTSQRQAGRMSMQEAGEYVWQQPTHTMGGFTTDAEYTRSLTELRLSVAKRREADALKDRFAEGLLRELQPHPNWIVWKYEGDQKPPFNPRALRGNYYKAASTKPRTWGTLDEALAALATNQFEGLGFMLDNKRIPLNLIDLDHCLKEERNRPDCTDLRDPRVLEIVCKMRSYTEVSPSGQGLHILVFGQLPGAGCKTHLIEMYDTGRYTTITGNHLAGTPWTIENRQDRLTRLYEAYCLKDDPPQVTLPAEQREVARSGPALTELPPQAKHDPLLQELLKGDISHFNGTKFAGDESYADYILLMKLLHWTGDDVALTRKLFLSSPLGQRLRHGHLRALEKQVNTDYLGRTIATIQQRRYNKPMQR